MLAVYLYSDGRISTLSNGVMAVSLVLKVETLTFGVHQSVQYTRVGQLALKQIDY